MTPPEIASISQLLQNSGYRVQTNTLPVPEAITTPTLIYSPTNRNLHGVEALRDRLAEAGHAVDLVPVSSGNHFYTRNNLGLYLHPAPPGPNRKVDIAGKELFGECPTVDATLQLNRDNSFSLSLIDWDDVHKKEVVTKADGSWKRDRQWVLLDTSHRQVRFRITELDKQTKYGRVTGVELRNESNGPVVDGCSFVYREIDPNE